VSSKITLNVAEQLIEKGNTLLKACVKKMHHHLAQIDLIDVNAMHSGRFGHSQEFESD